MKFWKKLLLGLFALFMLVIGIGFILPAKQHIDRSIVVRVKPEEVFNVLATLKRWPDWTAWTTNRFPDMTLRFEGAESGVGATMIAAGKSSGDGTVKIVQADPTSGHRLHSRFQPRDAGLRGSDSLHEHARRSACEVDDQRRPRSESAETLGRAWDGGH